MRNVFNVLCLYVYTPFKNKLSEKDKYYYFQYHKLDYFANRSISFSLMKRMYTIPLKKKKKNKATLAS